MTEWPRWVGPTKERVLMLLHKRAAQGQAYFALSHVRAFLRASGKGGVADFVLLLLKEEGLVEQVSPEVPLSQATLRLTEKGVRHVA